MHRAFSLYSLQSYDMGCYTSFSSDSPGVATVLSSSGGGTWSQTMTFTSGVANGYYISIAWKEADFASSGSSTTSGSATSSSTSTSGSGSNSTNGGSSGSGGNTSSSGGGLGTGSKIGLGVGLGLGIPLVLLVIGPWFVRSRSKVGSISLKPVD
jgi:hypothetical protein